MTSGCASKRRFPATLTETIKCQPMCSPRRLDEIKLSFWFQSGFPFISTIFLGRCFFGPECQKSPFSAGLILVASDESGSYRLLLRVVIFQGGVQSENGRDLM